MDHPVVVQNYRSAHDIAIRQAKGQATTEDLRRAMIHYRALFEDLVYDRKEAVVTEHRPAAVAERRTIEREDIRRRAS